MSNPILNAITKAESSALVAGQAHLHAYAAARIEAQAEIKTRRAVAQAQADHANAALHRWLRTVYEDLKWNVRQHDNAIVVPAPWSRSHCHVYGLSEPAGRLLRCIVEDTLQLLPPKRWLVVYNPSTTRWHVNLERFPTWGDAAAWLDGPGHVTPEQWMVAADKYHAGRRPPVHPHGQRHGLPHGQ